MTNDGEDFRWRSIVLPIILPSLVFGIGEGAIIPAIPLVAANLGGSLAIAGLVVALLTIGELVGNPPSGWIISRVGERAAMIGATAVAVVGLVICLIAPNPVALGFGVLLMGLATAMMHLARQAFLTSYVPLEVRARALATMGGVIRFGIFVGPFLTAGVIHLTGNAGMAFWVAIVVSVGAGVMLLTLPDPETTFGAVRSIRVGHRRLTEGEAEAEQETTGLFRTIQRNRAVLLRVGMGALLLGAVRAARQVILPLWGLSLGVGEVETSIVIGIAGGIDFALFYLSGWLMDRKGRLWSALPACVGMGIGYLMLAFTHDVPTAVTWFVIGAVVLSLANGVGSGILMTVASDLADPRNPAPFLGAFRFMGQAGGAGSPLLIAAVTALASLSIAVGLIGVLSLAAALVFLRYLPRYRPRSNA